MTKQQIAAKVQNVINFYGGKGDPPIQDVADSLNMSVDEAQLILQSLLADGGILRDKRGFLKRTEKHPKEKTEVPIHNIPVWIIRILMGAISIGAVGYSCYFTTIWLSEVWPIFVAVGLSIIMGIFAVSIIQVVILILEIQNRWKWVLLPVIGVMWLSTIIFSMGATVAGQYNSRMQQNVQQITKSTKTIKDQLLITQKQNEIKTIQEELTARQKDRDSMLMSLNKINELPVAERVKQNDLYNQIWARMNGINGRINQLTLDLQKARSDLAKMASDTAQVSVQQQLKQIKPFYTWIGELFAVKPDQVQFWTAIFPAIFLDILAPAGIAIAFFLRIPTKSRENRA